MSQKGNAIILLGPPGCGKSSLSNKMNMCSKIAVLESGNLLRKEIKKGSDQGKKIESYMEKGNLVPAEMTVEVVGRAMKNMGETCIVFDGFPRQLDQIIPFIAMITENNYMFSAVIMLQVSKDVAIKRIMGRRICSNCGEVYNVYFDPPSISATCDHCSGRLIKRKDDTKETVNSRWSNYEKKTKPIIDYFEENYHNKIHKISADKDFSQVADMVESLVRDIM
jgi:adenylate kinase